MNVLQESELFLLLFCYFIVSNLLLNPIILSHSEYILNILYKKGAPIPSQSLFLLSQETVLSLMLFFLSTVIYISALSVGLVFFFFFFGLFVFLGPRLRHVEVPRLGVQLELQPLACATATSTQDLSHVCDLHHSLHQCCILYLWSKARYQSRILMDASLVC